MEGEFEDVVASFEGFVVELDGSAAQGAEEFDGLLVEDDDDAGVDGRDLDVDGRFFEVFEGPLEPAVVCGFALADAEDGGGEAEDIDGIASDDLCFAGFVGDVFDDVSEESFVFVHDRAAGYSSGVVCECDEVFGIGFDVEGDGPVGGGA